jgi:hypothetical protein
MPERHARYLALRDGAAALRAQRLDAMPDREAQHLTSAFSTGLQTEASIAPEEAAALLAAAVADERNGVANAVESLTSWLTSHERFSEAWIAAVEHLVRSARELPPRTAIDSAS